MSVNILGFDKRLNIAHVTGLPVMRAWVRSHENSGRMAYLTIGWSRDHQHHRHAWYDRKTSELTFTTSDPHNTSCWELYPKEMAARDDARRALAALIAVLDGPW